MDDVRCKGVEYRLLDCSHRGIEVHDCNHGRDAGVVCMEGKNSPFRALHYYHILMMSAPA